MGGVNCIQTFFAFLDFFYIYKVPYTPCTFFWDVELRYSTDMKVA